MSNVQYELQTSGKYENLFTGYYRKDRSIIKFIDELLKTNKHIIIQDSNKNEHNLMYNTYKCRLYEYTRVTFISDNNNIIFESLTQLDNLWNQFNNNLIIVFLHISHEDVYQFQRIRSIYNNSIEIYGFMQLSANELKERM